MVRIIQSPITVPGLASAGIRSQRSRFGLVASFNEAGSALQGIGTQLQRFDLIQRQARDQDSVTVGMATAATKFADLGIEASESNDFENIIPNFQEGIRTIATEVSKDMSPNARRDFLNQLEGVAATKLVAMKYDVAAREQGQIRNNVIDALDTLGRAGINASTADESNAYRLAGINVINANSAVFKADIQGKLIDSFNQMMDEGYFNELIADGATDQVTELLKQAEEDPNLFPGLSRAAITALRKDNKEEIASLKSKAIDRNLMSMDRRYQALDRSEDLEKDAAILIKDYRAAGNRFDISPDKVFSRVNNVLRKVADTQDFKLAQLRHDTAMNTDPIAGIVTLQDEGEQRDYDLDYDRLFALETEKFKERQIEDAIAANASDDDLDEILSAPLTPLEANQIHAHMAHQVGGYPSKLRHLVLNAATHGPEEQVAIGADLFDRTNKEGRLQILNLPAEVEDFYRSILNQQKLGIPPGEAISLAREDMAADPKTVQARKDKMRARIDQPGGEFNLEKRLTDFLVHGDRISRFGLPRGWGAWAPFIGLFTPVKSPIFEAQDLAEGSVDPPQYAIEPRGFSLEKLGKPISAFRNLFVNDDFSGQGAVVNEEASGVFRWAYGVLDPPGSQQRENLLPADEGFQLLIRRELLNSAGRGLGFEEGFLGAIDKADRVYRFTAFGPPRLQYLAPETFVSNDQIDAARPYMIDQVIDFLAPTLPELEIEALANMARDRIANAPEDLAARAEFAAFLKDETSHFENAKRAARINFSQSFFLRPTDVTIRAKTLEEAPYQIWRYRQMMIDGELQYGDPHRAINPATNDFYEDFFFDRKAIEAGMQSQLMTEREASQERNLESRRRSLQKNRLQIPVDDETNPNLNVDLGHLGFSTGDE